MCVVFNKVIKSNLLKRSMVNCRCRVKRLLTRGGRYSEVNLLFSMAFWTLSMWLLLGGGCCSIVVCNSVELKVVIARGSRRPSVAMFCSLVAPPHNFRMSSIQFIIGRPIRFLPGSLPSITKQSKLAGLRLQFEYLKSCLIASNNLSLGSHFLSDPFNCFPVSPLDFQHPSPYNHISKCIDVVFISLT